MKVIFGGLYLQGKPYFKYAYYKENLQIRENIVWNIKKMIMLQ